MSKKKLKQILDIIDKNIWTTEPHEELKQILEDDKPPDLWTNEVKIKFDWWVDFHNRIINEIEDLFKDPSIGGNL